MRITETKDYRFTAAEITLVLDGLSQLPFVKVQALIPRIIREAADKPVMIPKTNGDQVAAEATP